MSRLTQVRKTGVVRAVRRAFEGENELYECRHCGRTLDGESSACPNCGAAEIAHYDL